MLHRLTALCFFPLLVGLSSAQGLQDTPLSQRADASAAGPVVQIAAWTAPKVQHLYGLPDSRPKAKGTLTVNNAGLSFASKAGQYTIRWTSMIALSNGSERVELWGTTGTLVRMVIPDGGGLAAAGVMHHRVYDLTVEFHDEHGSYHAAVFILPGRDATRVLESYTQAVPPIKTDSPATSSLVPAALPTCATSALSTRSVLVAEPNWSNADVPAAYRALVYEHIVDRLQNADGVGHVYRAGLPNTSAVCSQYTVTVSVVSFKPGSQVKRATMGPIGFFVGTTQMVFSAHIADASGNVNVTGQIKAIMRGESQSKSVADSVAKNIAKYYASSIKQYERNSLERRNASIPSDRVHSNAIR